MNNLIVFGAAGRTGRHVVDQAVEAGYNVSAFCYSLPPSGTFKQPTKVQVKLGNAYSSADVANALKGNDAVVNIIAPKLFDKHNYPISEIATKNIIHAMKSQGIRRYIGQAGAWATEQLEDANPFMRIGFRMPLPLKHIYYYKKIEDTIVKKSGLDWTLVRCELLTNSKQPHDYRIFTTTYRCKFFEFPTIRRRNVAQFDIRILKDPAYFQTCPIILE